MEELIALILMLLLLWFCAVGAIRTFRRNWIAALLLLIFLPGIWIIWLIIELFIEQPGPKIHNVSGTVRDALATTGDKNE